MSWWTATPTAGSFAAGLYFVIRAVLDWWPGLPGKKGFDAKGAVLTAAPFVLAYAYGVLVILGVGGIVGWLANASVWGVGWVGDGALIYGVGGTRQDIGIGGRQMALSNGGLMFILLATGFLVGVLKRSKTSEYTKRMVKWGALAGVLTGTVASVANALAIPLASTANAAGAWMNGVG